MSRNIGICSWSLQPTSAANLVEQVRATGIEAVQLALDPLRDGTWDAAESAEVLRSAGIQVLSGMVATVAEDYSSLESISVTGGLRPDETWEQNRAAALDNARLAKDLGLVLISFHAGFLPEDPGDPERTKLIARLREYVDIFAAQGIDCALETGQESAETLSAFLVELDRPSLGVNFDPANMILYDKGNPVRALKLLGPFVRQIHIKDAIKTSTPGTWGEEVPAGSGQVDWPAFFDVLLEQDLRVDLVIEREAGGSRIEDIKTAHALVQQHLDRIQKS